MAANCTVYCLGVLRFVGLPTASTTGPPIDTPVVTGRPTDTPNRFVCLSCGLLSVINRVGRRAALAIVGHCKLCRLKERSGAYSDAGTAVRQRDRHSLGARLRRRVPHNERRGCDGELAHRLVEPRALSEFRRRCLRSSRHQTQYTHCGEPPAAHCSATLSTERKHMHLCTSALVVPYQTEPNRTAVHRALQLLWCFLHQ